MKTPTEIVAEYGTHESDTGSPEVQVLDPQTEQFHQPQPGSIEKLRHQSWRALQRSQKSAHLLPAQHDRQPTWPGGASKVAEVAQIDVQHLRVEKIEGVQRLILCGGSDMVRIGQMTQERHNFRCAQLARMLPGSGTFPMEPEVTRDPGNIGLLRPERVMFYAQDFADLVEQFGFGIGNDERRLCRPALIGHRSINSNNTKAKRNQNLFIACRGYAAFPAANTC
jgi:hypothetical protein